jgi:hypothetical protein
MSRSRIAAPRLASAAFAGRRRVLGEPPALRAAAAAAGGGRLEAGDARGEMKKWLCTSYPCHQFHNDIGALAFDVFIDHADGERYLRANSDRILELPRLLGVNAAKTLVLLIEHIEGVIIEDRRRCNASSVW